jgi:hypothetical protein
MFSERTAYQIAAYFLHKAGGSMPLVKLMNLMYLADRQTLDTHGFSISGDDVVATRHGFALLNTLDLISGTSDCSTALPIATEHSAMST